MYSGSENGLQEIVSIVFLFYSSDHAFVRDSVNDWGNSTNLIKRNLGQSGNGQCLGMAKNLPQLRKVEVKMSCQC